MDKKGWFRPIWCPVGDIRLEAHSNVNLLYFFSLYKSNKSDFTFDAHPCNEIYVASLNRNLKSWNKLITWFVTIWLSLWQFWLFPQIWKCYTLLVLPSCGKFRYYPLLFRPASLSVGRTARTGCRRRQSFSHYQSQRNWNNCDLSRKIDSFSSCLFLLLMLRCPHSCPKN